MHSYPTTLSTYMILLGLAYIKWNNFPSGEEGQGADKQNMGDVNSIRVKNQFGKNTDGEVRLVWE